MLITAKAAVAVFFNTIGTELKYAERPLRHGAADFPGAPAISWNDPGCVKTRAAGQDKQW
jgi:hypothetical protein